MLPHEFLTCDHMHKRAELETSSLLLRGSPMKLLGSSYRSIAHSHTSRHDVIRFAFQSALSQKGSWCRSAVWSQPSPGPLEIGEVCVRASTGGWDHMRNMSAKDVLKAKHEGQVFGSQRLEFMRCQRTVAGRSEPFSDLGPVLESLPHDCSLRRSERSATIQPEH